MKMAKKQDYYDALYKLSKYSKDCKEEFNLLSGLIESAFTKKRSDLTIKAYLRRKCEHIAKVSGKYDTSTYMRYLLGPHYSMEERSKN